MKKRALILAAVTSLTLSSAFATQAPTPEAAPGKGMQHKQMQKGKKNAPFLIMGKMPHYTKMVMQHWDDLGLSDEQKEKLKQVRSATMGTIMPLKSQIAKLENEVAQAALSGEKPENLKAKVDQIAKLKAEATMAHIRCIHDTKSILNADQLAKLTQ